VTDDVAVANSLRTPFLSLSFEWPQSNQEEAGVFVRSTTTAHGVHGDEGAGERSSRKSSLSQLPSSNHRQALVFASMFCLSAASSDANLVLMAAQRGRLQMFESP